MKQCKRCKKEFYDFSELEQYGPECRKIVDAQIKNFKELENEKIVGIDDLVSDKTFFDYLKSASSFLKENEQKLESFVKNDSKDEIDQFLQEEANLEANVYVNLLKKVESKQKVSAKELITLSFSQNEKISELASALIVFSYAHKIHPDFLENLSESTRLMLSKTVRTNIDCLQKLSEDPNPRTAFYAKSQLQISKNLAKKNWRLK